MGAKKIAKWVIFETGIVEAFFSIFTSLTFTESWWYFQFKFHRQHLGQQPFQGAYDACILLVYHVK